MNIGIHGKYFEEENKETIQELLNELKQRDVAIFISQKYNEVLETYKIERGYSQIYTKHDNLSFLDLMISIGGDGTLLEAVTHIGSLETPVLGINTGRLGFLATTPRDQIKEAIQGYFNKQYTYDYRSLIRLEAEVDFFEGLNFGLNEFTILKADTSSMIVVHTYIDGEYLNSYWADGLIVATPTGSTGYSLSCGGPVVLPQSKNFIITPVSPHNLTVRPLVVSDNSTISFEVEARSNNFLISLDSRSHTVHGKMKMSVRKEDFQAKLLKINENSFLETLRQKLNWGLDIRN